MQSGNIFHNFIQQMLTECLSYAHTQLRGEDPSVATANIPALMPHGADMPACAPEVSLHRPASLPSFLFPKGTDIPASGPAHLGQMCPLPGCLQADLEASAQMALPVRCFLVSAQSGLPARPVPFLTTVCNYIDLSLSLFLIPVIFATLYLPSLVPRGHLKHTLEEKKGGEKTSRSSRGRRVRSQEPGPSFEATQNPEALQIG